MTEKTPKERRTEWTAALRSGNYKQGKRHLHTINDDSYCCLGVACDLFAEKEAIRNYGGGLDLQIYKFGVDLPSSAIIHRDMMAYLGLNNTDVDYFVNMNDFQHKSFIEIADYIDTLKDPEDDN